MTYIMLVVEVILIGLIMKHPKLQKVKLFLEKLFWLDKFNGDGFLRKGLQFYGKVSMLMYLVMVIGAILGWFSTFDSGCLFGTLFFGIGFPLCYRLVIGFQRYLHKI